MTRFLKKIVILIFVNLLVFSVLGGIVFFVLNYYCARKNTATNLGPIFLSGIHQNVRHELKPNTIVWSSGIEYKINSLGFRDNEYPFSKRTGAYRILCVGDSLTFGQGVKLNDTYAKALEKKLRNKHSRCVEVINTGVSGYNTYDEYWYIKDKLLKLNPDLIIVGFFIGNDPEDPEFEFNKLIIQHSLPGKDAPLISYFKKKMENIKLQKENYWERYMSLMWYPDGQQWKRCIQALRDIKIITEKNNIKLLVFIIPNTEPRPDSRIAYHRQLIDELKNLNIWYADVLPSLIEKGILYLPVSRENAHPNARMHKIYAEFLFDVLEKNGCIANVKKNQA